MSGVFGVINRKDPSGVNKLLSKMGEVMTHRPWYQVDTWADEEIGVGLGRIGIGIFNQEAQPVTSEDNSVVLVMAGEAYDMAIGGASDARSSDEEAVLALYERHGEEFVHHIRGGFIVAVLDLASRRLVIANDRFGLYPLFYTYRPGSLIFAPEMKGILCDQTFSKKLDFTALVQYMRFQHLLGERTFFEGIKLFPSASILLFDLSDGSCTIRPYWTFDDIPHRPEVDFEEAVEETGRLLRLAVRRLSAGNYRPGVYLSGGLDSRTILGLVERRPIVSLTYGARGCRDVHYAQRIAKAVGSDHHWFDLGNGRWVEEHADFHLELTEGFHSWIHAHGISTLPRARELVDVNLTGWDGGTVMGHRESIEPLQISAVDDLALINRMFHLFNQEYTWPSITEAEEHLLFCDAIGKKLRGLAFDSFSAEIRPFLELRPDVRAELFYLRNHGGRLTQNLITFTRSHIEVRFPFFDYDLFDFLYSLPAMLRGHQNLYRVVIQREIPRLAYIPYDHDEFLPTTHGLIRGIHALGVRLRRRVNRHIFPIFRERHTLYADYENHLRNELREWAEEILYDKRTSDRGIFQPNAVRSLMERHQSGLEQWTIGKIAPIITYEAMLRRFYDE